MEKYSRWSDLTTGTNPFVPHKQRLHDRLPVRALQALGGAALVVVRLPLVLAVGLVLVVTNVVTSILGFVPLLGRLLKRLVEWLLCSLLLLLMGVLVTEEDANTRRLGLASKSSPASSRVGPGDVVVCNHTSFLEVLYLARRFSPVFVFVTPAGASKGLVHACGLIEALVRALSLPVADDRATPRKLADVVARASGPVVVFPEGARSNGKSVLRFLPILEQLPLARGKAATRVHLVAFRYEYKHFSPSHSAGRGWKHVLWTLFYGYHSLRVTHLHAKDLDLQATAKQATLASAQVERLRGLLAAMLRAKPVDLSVADFVSFNRYWDHVTGGGKRSAAEFTDRKAPHEHARWTTTTT
ncbi:hypothetical protein P43SY_009827 [Pythium insidiosum]|uniref:Phospholipid/glycerol acyltransferase domain-containing protein n=1 Tax=Pythium insidiosum TaxID=114742 RepID=A0AAD5M1B5_PYTIN|nr:hypothetical protein P43SY_009827 [Pythium insidiosum]